MGLISVALSFKHMEGKSQWVAKQYGVELENYCVGNAENKLRIMKVISHAYSIPSQSILLVDDYYENLDRAANAGFSTCTPMEVVEFVERL